MSEVSIQSNNPENTPNELVLGIVAPLGTDLHETVLAIEEGLRLVGYRALPIRISDILKSLDLGIELKEEPEAARLESFMAAGTAARALSRQGEILALNAVSLINEKRPQGGAPLPKTAHLLLTLKHPEEVRLLRRIYGPGFYLIGVSSSRGDRLRYLIDKKGIPDDEAEELVRFDEEELDANWRPNEWGQRTRDTFHLADVFVRSGNRAHISRFLDLVFGDPFQTPTPEEHAMFIAYASSLRSADLSRQVGAAIVSARGDMIATGANDVAAPGGGLYWPGDEDARDFKLGKDINEQRRNEFVLDVMRRLFPESGESDAQILKRGKGLLEGSPIFDITEFGRAVHAEMDALIACARSSVSPRLGTLFCTTFPCHNCAKHIVASGLSRVVYVEPYPKSQAYELFRDSILLEDLKEKRDIPRSGEDTRVKFAAFSGIGPRRYIDLFSMGLGSGYKLKRKDEGGVKVNWKREAGRVRVPMLANSYLEREKLAALALENDLAALNKRMEEGHVDKEEPQHGGEQEILGACGEKRQGGSELAGMEKGRNQDVCSGDERSSTDGRSVGPNDQGQ
ncbi:anti-phage dCTP deaminase [Sorangium sp. So ce426]|uniref:anti-phage dCTP deaminase n=1 Tax=Sorangium sp. So ce426 TaxID=3133312 RepID=UPI003F5BC685